ncbi:MAG: 30S ribosomal protein S20 [Desulfovibrionales bacterium]|nr:30S ribosomal protein S20 [Desulfovibrionales bacterium]
MANHKSAIKRAKQSEKKQEINKAIKTRVKNVIKAVHAAMAEKSPDKAKESLVKAIPVIDKAASKGTLHHRNAARKISRLTKHVNALQSGSQS